MKILSAVCLILGCFLGAGFVSGAEIVCYFSKFGSLSYVACLIAGVVFFLLVKYYFFVSQKVKNTDEFLLLLGNNKSIVFRVLLSICILILTSAMFAGTSVLAETLQYNKMIVIALTMILSFLIVKNNVQGLSAVNNFLVPVMICSLLFIISGGKFTPINCNDVVSSVISGCGYVFINMVSLGLLIIEFGGEYRPKQQSLIAIICAIVITCLLIGLNYSIISNGLISESMPNLILSSKNKILYIVMQICIYLGLFTTLVSNLFLLKNYTKVFVKKDVFSLILSILIAYVVSLLGFENLIEYSYIYIGCIGVFMLVFSCNKKSV